MLTLKQHQNTSKRISFPHVNTTTSNNSSVNLIGEMGIPIIKQEQSKHMIFNDNLHEDNYSRITKNKMIQLQLTDNREHRHELVILKAYLHIYIYIYIYIYIHTYLHIYI